MGYSNLNDYLDYLVDWLKNKKEETRSKGFIVGLSGGIDSAVVAALLKKAVGDDCLAVALPCYSNPKDLKDAKLVADAVGIKFEIYDLAETFDTFGSSLWFQSQKQNGTMVNSNSFGNIKARLRMTTLYAIGQTLGYLVVGTDNADEWYTGYFTKFGDGGIDLAPLLNLTKGQVREAAKLLGIPQQIIDKPPTAGLVENSISDEEDLGVSYESLDAYILGDDSVLTDAQKNKIERLHLISEHKRNTAATPDAFNKNLRK